MRLATYDIKRQLAVRTAASRLVTIEPKRFLFEGNPSNSFMNGDVMNWKGLRFQVAKAIPWDPSATVTGGRS